MMVCVESSNDFQKSSSDSIHRYSFDSGEGREYSPLLAMPPVILCLVTFATTPVMREEKFFSVSDMKSVVLVVSSVHREMSDGPNRYAVVSAVWCFVGEKTIGQVRAKASTAHADVESVSNESISSSHDCTDPPNAGVFLRGNS
jgi:hypothetical protein